MEYYSTMKRYEQRIYQVKEVDRKCYVLYDSIYVAFWKRQGYWGRLQR
jgi:hypothetical protein